MGLVAKLKCPFQWVTGGGHDMKGGAFTKSTRGWRREVLPSPVEKSPGHGWPRERKGTAGERHRGFTLTGRKTHREDSISEPEVGHRW